MTHAHTNRLAQASSPYLRGHAHNPVDWYPWGEEALGRARAEDKPIFLSIGYAACHWCHVMERESFEDPGVAAFLNEHFVAIKVDREERPDLDAVYMTAVQALTGGGGWPLSAFLTPEQEPFYGGTYFPPDRRWGRPSFLEVLRAIREAWSGQNGLLRSQAAGLTRRLAALSQTPPDAAEVDHAGATARALAELSRQFDRTHGGFGDAPKFPTPSRLYFLLRLAASGDGSAREMLAATLDGMAAGGMVDWVGGGFHRYSVDAEWLIPHFEKMLYDNALLARVYAEAGTLLDRPEWTSVARSTADYLLREMQGPEGGFFSSTDADSQGEEGLYFTWTADEVRAALPAEEAEAIVRLCALDGPANFENGRSALRPQLRVDELAAPLGIGAGEAASRVEGGRTALLAARSTRVRPATDNKRLAGWNGMAIWSLARLGVLLDEPRYLEGASRAGEFVRRELLQSDGSLVRSWRDGARSGAETLEDVAWVAAAFVELYQADGEPRWLEAALRLVDARLPRYRGTDGALFDAPDDGEPLVLRPRNALDGATPASSAVLADVLLRLAALTGRPSLAAAAERAVRAESGLIGRVPEGCATLLTVAAAMAAPPRELVIVGDPRWSSTLMLRRVAARHSWRLTANAVTPQLPVPSRTVSLVPLFGGREACPGGQALAYLCVGGTCRLPTSDPETLADLLTALV